MRQPAVIDEKQLENVANNATAKATDSKTSTGPKNKPAVAKVLSSSSKKWTVPVLEANFDLEKAKVVAFNNASYYMNNVLNYDDLHVEMAWDDESNPMGHVKDVNTGKLVNSYEGTDLLKVYSQNRKERGIIVDGRV